MQAIFSAVQPIQFFDVLDGRRWVSGEVFGETDGPGDSLCCIHRAPSKRTKLTGHEKSSRLLMIHRNPYNRAIHVISQPPPPSPSFAASNLS